ncbi:MAG: hypothetical protein QOF06_19 [Solirubrobacterales bacterium]|nr:hypothetical protein [Solirubrobacterales bacterium]
MQREIRVPDGKHTLVESMKAAAGNPLLDRRVGISKAPQLPNRHHPVLPASQSRQLLAPP